MKGDMLKRIVRAIAEGSQGDLDRLARKVIEAERDTGHIRLAEDLESILRDSKRQTSRQTRVSPVTATLREIPHSRRYGEQLITVSPRESLEHDMVLPPETESRFARIEHEYAARERLEAYGLRPRRTVLLHGPPGCGKSLGAKRLAWNTGLPLMKVRFDAMVSSYFGESAANLRSVFTLAKEKPCVLLFDECDFIARSRVNSKDIGEASRIVNSLLQLMEEYDAAGLLVATTNVESSLDEALFRRFDEILYVPPPGPREIKKLLRLTLSAVPVDDHLDWDCLVRSLSGAPAAMVVKAARDAAKAAVLHGRKTVLQDQLESAIRETRRQKDESSES